MGYEAAFIGAEAGGTAMQVIAARGSAKSQEAIAEYNAAVMEKRAEVTRVTSAEEKKILRDRLRKELARNEVSMAGSGFGMAGSPLDAQLGVIEDYAHNIAHLGYNREVEARGYESQAAAFRMQAKAAKEAGELGVGQALFGGVSSFAKFKLMQNIIRT